METHIIYVLQVCITPSGEFNNEPAIPVTVTSEQLQRIEDGETIHSVVPDWKPRLVSFEARHESVCSRCSAPIHIGQRITKSGNVHDGIGRYHHTDLQCTGVYQQIQGGE